MEKPFVNIPKMDDFLADIELMAFTDTLPRERILRTIRQAMDNIRRRILDDELNDLSREALFSAVKRSALRELNALKAKRPRKVINATGVVIHTNLGRAPLSEKAANACSDMLSGYMNLEYDTETGERGSRLAYAEKLLTDLTGAEAALVVNNNAAAIYLVLNTLAKNREVVISRGEMVEIGGSFRVSEIIAQSGCTVVECGTTNRTHLTDYEQSLSESTAVLLKVHTSNFKIVGFTSGVPAKELAGLAKKHGRLTVEDMGSGVLIDLAKYGLSAERRVQDALKEGVDLVTFSGDKMLGGPQAGIIAGRKALIDQMKKNQMLRCLRIDKLGLVALTETLKHYFGDVSLMELPIMQSLLTPYGEVLAKAKRLRDKLAERAPGFTFAVGEHDAQIGGGSLPGEVLKSAAVFVKHDLFSASTLAAGLRRMNPPVVSVVADDRVILDVRTIGERDFDVLAQLFQRFKPTHVTTTR